MVEGQSLQGIETVEVIPNIGDMIVREQQGGDLAEQRVAASEGGEAVVTQIERGQAGQSREPSQGGAGAENLIVRKREPVFPNKRSKPFDISLRS